MGRPIQKKYFGNTNVPQVGGESLAAVALGTAGTGYSQGLTATVSAPQLPGGVNAAVSVAVNPATGAITGYTVTTAGAGYTSAPTVTLVPATTVTRAATGNNTETTLTLASTTGLFVGMQVTGSTGLGTGNAANSVLIASVDSATQVTVATAHDGAVSGTLTFTDIGASGVPGARTLTATKANAITVSAFVTGGSAKTGDIIRQTGSRRYRVATADGTENLKLVAAAPAAGEMTMTAEDSAGGTYYVTKLTAHRAVIVKGDRTGTQFTTGVAGISVPWTLDTPTASVSVKIQNA